MKPFIGAPVHYVSRGSADGVFPATCRAAIVTEVPDGVANPQVVGLAVLNPTGLFFDRSVVHDEGRRPGTWHWPEQTPDPATATGPLPGAAGLSGAASYSFGAPVVATDPATFTVGLHLSEEMPGC